MKGVTLVGGPADAHLKCTWFKKRADESHRIEEEHIEKLKDKLYGLSGNKKKVVKANTKVDEKKWA